jgi:hypothetical protein
VAKVHAASTSPQPLVTDNDGGLETAPEVGDDDDADFDADNDAEWGNFYAEAWRMYDEPEGN